MTFESISKRYNNKVTIFQKKPCYSDYSKCLSKVFFNKRLLYCGKLWLFGLFSGDKGDNIDMWMIKITIKANEIDMDVLLIS